MVMDGLGAEGFGGHSCREGLLFGVFISVTTRSKGSRAGNGWKGHFKGELEMTKSNHGMSEVLSIIGAVFIASFVLMFSFTSEDDTNAGSLPDGTTAKTQGDAERGRKLFDGKGICYYCHGIDGYLNQPPELNPETK